MPNLITRARHAVARWVGPKAHGAQVRRFSGARIDRISGNWLATEVSINQELRGDLNLLRARGRDLANNNDYAVKFVGMVRDNIIGPGGIRLQVRVEDGPGKPDRLANDAIEAAWKDWCQACDITGQQTLRDICNTLVGGLPTDGEFLVRMVQGRAAGNKYGLALQIIDVDRIDTTYNVGATSTTNAVIMGVEVDAYRRPLALHLFAAHPSDGVQSSRQRIRVPMSEVLHKFQVQRAEQVRGIPWMAPGMLSLHHLGNFKLSALLAAEHGANHYGFFTTPDGAAPIGAMDETGQAITASQPGTFDTLPQGVGFQAYDSKYPNEVFGPFVKTTLQRIASGWRVAYHSLANDLEGVSYSSIRSGALEERDRWAADQEWFISAFMEPVFKVWLQNSLLLGAITMPTGSALPAAKIDKFSKHDWQPRRWEWVDPQGDMQAKILAVKAGLMAPQDLANAMGYDFDDVLTAIAMAQKQAAALGVQLTAYDPTPGAQAAPPPPAAAKPAPQDSMTSRAIEMLGNAITQMNAREQLPPVNHITINQPEQRTEVHHHQPAPIVEVKNNFTMPEITNNFEPKMPAQKAADPTPVTVIVKPADVTVNNAFASEAVQTVVRDANDEIVKTVTKYTA